MKRLLAAAAVAAVLAPAAQAQDFSLYRGSEVRIEFDQVRALPDLDRADALTLDTRHRVWIAPFLGAQIDLAAAAVDWSDAAYLAGMHLHAMPEGGNRFGVFYLPIWDDRVDGRIENYGAEAMVAALPALTVEARVGRFGGDAVEGPYFGTLGTYALTPQLSLIGSFEHSRLDHMGADVRASDALVGAEFLLPGTGVRLRGAAGVARFTGDVASATELRLTVGATVLAFGEAGTTARTRSFGRQSLLGLF